MKKYTNPDNFFARFIANFSLFYSAALVVMGVAFLTGHWNTFMCTVGLLGFSVFAALLRAAISKPGTPFMESPVFRTNR